MIIGALTIGAIIVLLLTNGIKVWNLYNKGTKYNWIWTMMLFGLAVLAYGALFNNLMLTFYSAIQDSYLQPDYWEASNYFLFGTVMLFLSLALTLGEVMVHLGFLFRGLGESEDRESSGFKIPFFRGG